MTKKKQMTTNILEQRTNTDTGFDLDTKKKELYKSNLYSIVNKDHGIKNESSALDIFQAKFECQLDVSQRFYKKLVYTDDIGNQWYICGKLDGIDLDDKYIVEVKNRTKSFFSTVRDYEMTQIQLYMYMANVSLAKLVECKNGAKIKVTDIAYDECYIQLVLQKLQAFLKTFSAFVYGPIETKQDYITMDVEDKEWFVHKMYHTYSNKQSKSNKRKTLTCLLESDDELD
jgi:hypothetical protein